MGMDLNGTDRFGMPRYERINNVGWLACMKMAEAQGWKPAQEPDFYLRNAGQEVSDADAKSLGKALLRALDDDAAMRAGYAFMSAEHDARLKGLRERYENIPEVRIGPTITLDDFRWGVEGIATYCLRGGFEIH
jgi:hypothetical protein